MVVCWALLLGSYSVSTNAQNIVEIGTTGNLINFGTSPTATSSTWQNVGQMGGSLQCWAPGQPGYCGPRPYVNANVQGAINFSYGQTDLYQNINTAAAVNQAVSNATGIHVTGFNFGFRAKNGNGWDNGQQDYLGAYVSINGNTYDYTNQTNRRYNWTNFNFTETFATPFLPTTTSIARVGFVGRDTNGWAGPYGPEVTNVSFSLRYGVDPCVLNPASNPNCSGYDKIVTSPNLVPNPDGYAYGGQSVNNSFSINKAFEMAGTGLMIHGFRWGYVANANGPYCADNFLFWCIDNRTPSVTTNVSITNNTGANLYNVSRTYTNSNNTTNYQYLFPSSQQLGNLGSFNFTASANDQAYIGSMWSRAVYTPDQCMRDPLSSPTCPGYAKAYANQLASTSGTTTSAPTTTTIETSPTTTTVTTSPTTTSPITTSATTTTADVTQPVTTTASTTSAPTTTAVATTSVSATPTANNPQPKVGEVTTAGSQPTASKSSMSTSQVLSMISSQQSQQSRLEMAVAGAAVEQAKQDAAKTTNDAQTVAANQQSQTLANAQEITTKETAKAQSAVSGLGVQQSSVGTGIGLIGFQSSNNVIAIGGLRAPDLYSLSSQQSTTSNNFGLSVYTPMTTNNYRIEKEETKSFEQQSSFDNRSAFSQSSPINNAMNAPILIAPLAPAPTGPSVNTKAKDNDAAGGVSLASIAKQPQGFELYMGGMVDRPFYAPKEIYKGQKVVDNARAQRLLNGASDRLHQQMVDQQYKLGN